MTTEDKCIERLRANRWPSGLGGVTVSAKDLAVLFAAYNDRGRKIDALKMLIASNHRAYLNAIGVTPENPAATK
jgi:hypothetical protein